MPVFDFSGASASKAEAKCTYTTFHSSHTKPSPEQPIMVLDNKERQWKHHSCGVFTNPVNRTAFDFKEEDGNHTADVVKIDSRFTSLLKWLGDSRINVRLSGTNREDGYAYGNPDLQIYGILGSSVKRFDVKVLLNPFKVIMRSFT